MRCSSSESGTTTGLPFLRPAGVKAVNHSVRGLATRSALARGSRASGSVSHGRLRSSSALGASSSPPPPGPPPAGGAAPPARERASVCGPAPPHGLGRLLHVRLGCPPGLRCCSRSGLLVRAPLVV